MNRSTASLLVAYLVVAVGASWLSPWLDDRFQTTLGLAQSFHSKSFESPPLFRRITQEISLDFLTEQPDLPRRSFRVRWDGFWYLSTTRTVDLYLGADDHATLRLDGDVVLERRAGQRTGSRTVTLDAGAHRLTLLHEQDRGRYQLNVQWAPAGQAPRPFDPETLFPAEPDDDALVVNERLRAFRALVPMIWIAPPALLGLAFAVPFLRRNTSRISTQRWWQIAGLTALVIVLSHYGSAFYTHHLPPNILAVGLVALYFVLPPAVRARRRWRMLYWALCSVVLIALDAYIGVPGGMTDFRKAQYRAGAFLLTNPEYAYDDVCGSYAYLPFSGLLFVPFGVFPRATAYLLYTMVGRLTVLAAVFWLAKFFQVRDWKLWLLLLLLAFNGPLDRIMWLGNSTHFILLLLLGAVYALHAKRPIVAGVLFGLAPLLKPSMLLLGVYFVLRRNWRVVAGWAGALSTSVLLSLLFWGYDLHAKWLDTCIFQFQGGAIPAFRAQSIDGFLAKHYLPGTNVYDWTAVPVDATFQILHYVGVLLVMGPAVLAALQTRSRTEPGTTYLEVFIFICAAILISPISWSHYYVFLLLPIAFYAGERFPRRCRAPGVARVLTAVFVLAVVLSSLSEEVSVTFYRAQETDLSRLLLSHYFFGGVLFYLFLLAQRFTGAMPSPSPAAGRRAR